MSNSSYSKSGANVQSSELPDWRGVGQVRADWQSTFARHHKVTVLAVLAGLLILAAIAPQSLPSNAGLLLVGSALIGVPHGGSDFVVAHRLFAPRLQSWWLPAFLSGYLALTGTVLLGWWLVPASTLLVFLAVSAFHFGAGPTDQEVTRASLIRGGARALTPTLPIFLFHSGDVAEIIGPLVSMPAADITALLSRYYEGLLIAYAVLLASAMLATVLNEGPHRGEQIREIIEIIVLAVAAWVLPPLLTFALFFCGIHAVRHMTDLVNTAHPGSGRAAFGLAAYVLIPSALACCAVLGMSWGRFAGAMTDTAVLCAGVRVVAALTVPHVALEWWATRTGRSSPGDRF